MIAILNSEKILLRMTACYRKLSRLTVSSSPEDIQDLSEEYYGWQYLYGMAIIKEYEEWLQTSELQ